MGSIEDSNGADREATRGSIYPFLARTAGDQILDRAFAGVGAVPGRGLPCSVGRSACDGDLAFPVERIREGGLPQEGLGTVVLKIDRQ